MPEFKYKAFISYSHVDENWARWVHRSLETYRVPKHIVREHELASNRLIPIFRDREELASSGDLSATIQQALANSENLIVICSPSAAESKWVNEEIKRFKQHGKADSIFCLLIGEPAESFPSAALVDVDRDGIATAEETEPLAADARPGFDSKHNAKLKLIAGLLGTGLDQLTRRETQRRNRRMLAITTGSMLGMAFAITLSIFALMSRSEAEQQKLVAEREAATATQVSEFLVDLFEASDPFAESQGDLTVRELLDRGTDRLEHGLHDEPEVRARLLATIGQVHTQLGSYDVAQTFLDDALAVQQSLLSPDDPQILRTQTRRAWLATETGDYERAQSIYDAVLPALENGALYSDLLEPNSAWATIINDLGVLQWSVGDYETAKSTIEQALLMLEIVHGKEHLEVATTLNNLGLAYAYSGDFESARPLYERSLSIIEGIQGPDHPGLTSVVLNLASTVRSLGDYDAAQSLLERGLKIAEVSFASDHPVFAHLNNGLGIVLLRRGDYDHALEVLEHAGSLYVLSYGETGPGVAANLQHQARVLHAQGNLEASRRRYEQSALAGGGHGSGTASELASVLEKLGDIDGALEHHRLANELVSKTFAADNPFVIGQLKRYEEFLQRNGLEP